MQPNEKRAVTIKLEKRAFSYWNVQTSKWYIEQGRYGILVGASSRDIRLTDYIII